MMRLGLAATSFVTAAALAVTASAAPPSARAIVIGRVDGGPWTDAPTEARLDQHAELAVVVVAGRHALAPAGITSARVTGRALALEPLVGAHVAWSAVEPHGFRTSTAPNGATSDFYSNVSTEPRTFGKWLGFDHIDYFERPLAAAIDQPIITAAVVTDDQQVPGLGTMRFKVDVELADGTRATSPGAEATDTFGITRAVHRVSIRASDDFMGWLTAYMLVPEVFGSAGGGIDNQTDRFNGADCADVMVGALRRTGRPLAYTNVAGLPDYTQRVAGSTELDDHGVPAHPITGVARRLRSASTTAATSTPSHAARLGSRRRAVGRQERSGRPVSRRPRWPARWLRSRDPHGPPAPDDRAAREPSAGDDRRAALAPALAGV